MFVCFLAGGKAAGHGESAERPAREEGEAKRARKGVERGQGARLSTHGPRLRDHVVLVL